jgi:hypothetical protein
LLRQNDAARKSRQFFLLLSSSNIASFGRTIDRRGEEADQEEHQGHCREAGVAQERGKIPGIRPDTGVQCLISGKAGSGYRISG